MPKAQTPSFILELPLAVPTAMDRLLVGRFEAGRRLYNTILSEGLKRLSLMRQSKAWQRARAMPKGAARTAAFKACSEQFGFSEYALHAAIAAHKNAARLDDRMSANEAQKIATRVWKALQEYCFGAQGKPRFKGKGRPLHSIEGKTNAAGIRWHSDTGCVSWGKGFILPAKLPNKTQDLYLHEALSCKTKYCRLVWRNIKGRRQWFVQLVQEGLAPAKYDFLATGQVVGIDLGPSTVAIIGDEAVGLEPLAPSVVQPWKEMRTLQRAQDRSRRSTNPNNYLANGTVKKGAKTWKRSERYKARQAKLADLERRLAATRKKEHGALCNRIVGLGNVVQAEGLSYVAFQKCFGRSVKVRAPGEFISRLIRKAESAGGQMIELNTRVLRMSQYDHVSGTCEKKPLSQRWHRLGGATGTTWVQRDAYSAFLAKHSTEERHNPTRLKEGWAAAEPLLRRAGLCVNESANGAPKGAPAVAIPPERIARQRRQKQGLGRNVVGETRESGCPLPFRL